VMEGGRVVDMVVRADVVAKAAQLEAYLGI
jgi:hypothetical protein